MAAVVACTSDATADQQHSQTSCQSVVHVGDSLSLGITAEAHSPGAEIASQYEAAGVRTSFFDVAGGRSSIETVDDKPNAVSAAQELSRTHPATGRCWVLQIGTNDAANISAGSGVDATARIDQLMHVVGDEPVLWPNLKTIASAPTHYEPENMVAYNGALMAACTRYPNLRIYDAAADLPDTAFVDGIHHTGAGSEVFAGGIAGALATAFPVASDPTPACVVGSTTPGSSPEGPPGPIAAPLPGNGRVCFAPVLDFCLPTTAFGSSSTTNR
ncbi:SGNH/GDSL hydrolase family protein [Williamsia soli]|uniref:SGNH/GDSL hydrolase family protein n=1 Tax=Williamsia soli TaxID=364929 RepID=UPI001A9F2868|nr:SGNH/GDSL hydrolase family protein [Williamsia soli]